MSGRAPRRVRLDLAYDGTGFAGWQRQPGERTVQGELEAALGRLHGGSPVAVRGAGRTDAGVHARRQVADAEVRLGQDDAALAYALRRLLPPDVRATAVVTMPDGFHARRDAAGKTYRYRVDRSAHGDPFLARYALHRPRPWDEAAIRDALSRLPGRRDWTAFSSSSCEVADRVRTVRLAELETEGDVAWFTFEGDGFLTHMVRILVGTLLEVGRGRFEPGQIDRALAAGDRSLAGPTVAPRGLFLWDVRYH